MRWFCLVVGLSFSSNDSLASQLSFGTAHRTKVSSGIFGQNIIYGPADGSDSALAYPVKRFGGNVVSRYNWQSNATNTGKDWYFMNTAVSIKVPGFSSSPNFVDGLTRKISRDGGRLFLNVPFIGWVAKDPRKKGAYSVKKYGSQQKTEPYDPKNDMGNGVLKNGKMITNNSPKDTSVKVTAKWTVRWLSNLTRILPQNRIIVGLGNEPTIWDETHRDLRFGDKGLSAPPVGYEELWQRTRSYARAIKSRFPKIKTAGPGSWGGGGYFSSGIDRKNAGGCTNGTDRQKHGGTPLLAWYMQRICAASKDKSKPLIDYLDIHYYPENFDFADESAQGHHKRFQAIRSLYDSKYKDPSWINEPIALIPRMQKLIADNCPGMKLSISEYRFGTSNRGISTALAQVATLGIFAEHGVDLATHFHPIEPNSLLEAAFRLFVNYDGKGSHVFDSNYLPVSVSHQNLRAFGFQKGSRKLIYLINYGTQPVTPTLPKNSKPTRAFTLNRSGLSEDRQVTSKIEAMSAKLLVL